MIKKKGYEFVEIKKENDEALFNESRQKSRDELLIQYETEKKEHEIEHDPKRHTEGWL